MLDALLAGRIGQVHAVPLEAESLEVEPEPVARLTDEQREAIAYGVMLCDATAGMANDRATIDGASRAADVLRGLLERQE
jgi:aspartate aminotransferase-like enzyme